MGAGFWMKRFLIAFAVAVGILFIVQLTKGDPVAGAAQYAAQWGSASSALFTLIGYIRYKRDPACMLPQTRR